MIGAYPKIYNLGHAAILDLLLDDVLVEEKIDGSQISFGVEDTINGTEIHIRSKEAEIDPHGPPKMFAAAVETITALAPRLTPGFIYRGEYLSKPKHNVLAYNRVPEKNIILFDVSLGGERYLQPLQKTLEAERLGLEVVPAICFGRINSYEQFVAMLDQISILGGQKIEGVVIKNYTRFGARDGHALMGKFVSEAYKEIHSAEWKSANPAGRDILTMIGDAITTPSRWEKAIQHLRDRGEIQNDPHDIGPLLQEIERDTLAETQLEVMDRLMKWAWPHLRRTLVRGFPQWYKERLARQQFVAAPAITPETERADAAV